MEEIAKLLAQRPINVEAKVMSTSDQFTNNFKGTSIGYFTNQLNDNTSQNNTQNIDTDGPQTPAAAAKEIQELLLKLARDNLLATDIDRANYIRTSLPKSYIQ